MTRFEIGYNALLKHENVKQIALVNHKDNFHLAVDDFVWCAIMESFGSFNNYTDTEAMSEFDRLCDEAKDPSKAISYAIGYYHKGILYAGVNHSNPQPSRSPLVRSICNKVYDEIHAQENSPSLIP